MPPERYLLPPRTDVDDPDPYWTHEVVVGEGRVWRDSYFLRLKAHVSAERYATDTEIVPDIAPHGERLYVQAHAYVLVPDISVTVGLYPSPATPEAVGEVTASEWTGMRPVEIGNAQAWHYPADKTLVLWECYLTQRVASNRPPQEDETWKTLWHGLEWFLT